MLEQAVLGAADVLLWQQDAFALARVVATQPIEPVTPADSGNSGEGSSVSPSPSAVTPTPGPGSQPSSPPAKKVTRRFWGVKTLNPDRPAADFANIQQEVLAHLEAADGVTLEVRIEITASTPDGFTEQQVRTVRENAAQLKFEDTGFEEN